VAPLAIVVSIWIAVFPNVVSHKNVKPVGTNNTVSTNSRTVRPRDIRAIKVPTKGDHEIHHAQ